jgi:hypothetical protein
MIGLLSTKEGPEGLAPGRSGLTTAEYGSRAEAACGGGGRIPDFAAGPFGAVGGGPELTVVAVDTDGFAIGVGTGESLKPLSRR